MLGIKTPQIILITPLIFFAACLTPPSSIRGETGALGEDEFLAAGWQSSNFEQSTAAADCALVVLVSNEKNEVDQEFSSYLETELGHLKRFPVIPMNAGRTGTDAYFQLERMGLVELPDGSRIEPSRALVFSFEAHKQFKEYTSVNTPSLSKLSMHIFEYWYEGLLNITEIGPGGQSSLVYSDRTFRSRSSWKPQTRDIRGVYKGKGHNPKDSDQRDRAYREARNSVLFKISKEVYSRLGIQGQIDSGLKSNGKVLISTGIGNNNGVQPGQPMFIYFVQGNLQIPIAKAIVQNVSSNGSTMEVVEWASGDDRAAELAADPEGYIKLNMSKLYARTEGLRKPEEWSERMQAIERLIGKRVEDNAWGDLQPDIQALVNSR